MASETKTLEKNLKTGNLTAGQKLIKFLKNKFVIFAGLIILFVISVFFLFLMDASNLWRPKWMDNNGMKQFAVIFGLKEFNVDMTTWFITFLFWITVLLVFFILFLRKPFKEVYDRKYHVNDAVMENKKRLSAYQVFYITAAVIGVVLYTVVLAIWPWSQMKWGDATEPLVNLLSAMGIFLCLFLIVPLCIAAFVLIFKFFVFLVSIVVSNVSRSVISSNDYQEVYAASKVASDKIREELEVASQQVIANAKAASMAASAQMMGGYAAPSFGAYVPRPNINAFPGLSAIDKEYAEAKEESKEEDTLDLSKLATGFQAYLANKRHLYYGLDMLRSFLAAFASSRMVMLQGLSRTGKTSLPREFASYTQNSASFYPVQATWKDKSDVVGYNSDFTGEYKETEMLKNLYRGAYTPNKMNLLVLDEANISRIEYYFADFLSVLEYPEEEWLISLVQPKEGVTLPTKLENGKVRIPTNTYFVATINVDDSTFSISDKVYDRFMTIDFEELNTPFKANADDKPVNVSMNQLNKAFEEAQNNPSFRISASEMNKFMKLCNFVSETFDVKIGNRIYNQISKFVPVFAALGGTKEAALDLMFKTKVLRKVDNLYDSYVEEGLNKLSKMIATAYGVKAFTLSQKAIVRLKKKFN